MNSGKEQINKFYATGKRKTAIAKVWISKHGSGKLLINNKNATEYFKRSAHLKEIIKPFSLLNTERLYDVVCKVIGSGMNGQTGAVRLGISKALCKIDNNYYTILKNYGLITRDSRRVERKKYGQPKARKKFQFSKR